MRIIVNKTDLLRQKFDTTRVLGLLEDEDDRKFRFIMMNGAELAKLRFGHVRGIRYAAEVSLRQQRDEHCLTNAGKFLADFRRDYTLTDHMHNTFGSLSVVYGIDEQSLKVVGSGLFQRSAEVMMDIYNCLGRDDFAGVEALGGRFDEKEKELAAQVWKERGAQASRDAQKRVAQEIEQKKREDKKRIAVDSDV